MLLLSHSFLCSICWQICSTFHSVVVVHSLFLLCISRRAIFFIILALQISALCHQSAEEEEHQEHQGCGGIPSFAIIMSENNEAATGFTCFNINCYTTFRTERGLRQHLWRSDACREYMSLPRPPVADGVNVPCESSLRRRWGYKVESLRLNPSMSADPPSYEPYAVFDFSADVNVEGDFIDDEMVCEWDDNSCVAIGMLDDVAISCPVFYAMMERIVTSER